MNFHFHTEGQKYFLLSSSQTDLFAKKFIQKNQHAIDEAICIPVHLIQELFFDIIKRNIPVLRSLYKTNAVRSRPPASHPSDYG